MCSPFSQRSSYPTKYPDFPKMIKLSPNFQLHIHHILQFFSDFVSVFLRLEGAW